MDPSVDWAVGGAIHHTFCGGKKNIQLGYGSALIQIPKFMIDWRSSHKAFFCCQHQSCIGWKSQLMIYFGHPQENWLQCTCFFFEIGSMGSFLCKMFAQTFFPVYCRNFSHDPFKIQYIHQHLMGYDLMSRFFFPSFQYLYGKGQFWGLKFEET